MKGTVSVLTILALALPLPAATAPAQPLAAADATPPEAAATPAERAQAARQVADATVEALEERRAPADRVREAIETGGLVAWTAAAIRASGHEPPAMPSLPPITGAPGGISRPVAGLFAAARAAETFLGPIAARDLASSIDRLHDAVVLRASIDGPADRPIFEERLAGVRGLTRRAAMPTERAAMLLAAALDRHLPAMRASASDLAANGGSVVGCDILDRLPYLCVGSGADNTYTESAVLLVDQGGSDTYRNSAGGAPFPDPGNPGQFIQVSANVDLGEGDDVYLSPPRIVPGTQPQVIGQGASGPRSVGILVDDGGDDAYEAVAPTGPGVALVAQGSGAGIGILADLGGEDRYTAGKGTAPGSGLLNAQGVGVQGLGLLVDLGGGDDAYAVDVPGNADGGCYITAAQASVVTGAGILSDDGGRDRFVVTGSAEQGFGFHDNPDFVGGSWFCPTPATPGLATYAQAAQFGSGAAFLLTGEGNTEYRAEQEAGGPLGFFRLNAQAIGASVPQSPSAVLDDRGGDDIYVVEETIRTNAEVVIEDGCTDCESIVVSRENTPQRSVQAQGIAEGVLWDHGDGDDTYRASFEGTVSLHVSDARTPAEQPPSSIDARAIAYFWPRVHAQGAGSAGFTPMGGLVDEEGTDSYRVRATNLATATTDSPSTVRARAYTFWRPDVTAQGGAGALLDRGGQGDTFSVASVSEASAPDPADEFSLARQDARPHAFRGGRFVALGTDPLVESHPYTPACVYSSPGYRGHGWWVDSCGPLSTSPGLGWAGPSDGRAPSLTFAEPPPAVIQIGERVPLSARLLDPDGGPKAGAEVHFVLRQGVHESLATAYDALDAAGLSDPWAHWDTWHATAVTDEGGVARVSIPVETLRVGTNLSPDYRWMFVATYDGDGRAVYPQVVSAPVELAG